MFRHLREKIAVGPAHDLMPPVTGPGAKTMAGIGAAGLGAMGLGAAGALGGLGAAGAGIAGAGRAIGAGARAIGAGVRANPGTTAAGAAFSGYGSAQEGNSPGRVAFDTAVGGLSAAAVPNAFTGGAGRLLSKFPRLNQAAQSFSAAHPRISKALGFGRDLGVSIGTQAAASPLGPKKAGQ